jgi:hypothetical protein
MTDKQYLEGILNEQTLAPGGPELTALLQHREDVKKILRGKFGDSPSIREGGSKAKGTMIKESYDLDLPCYFPHDDNIAGTTLKEIYETIEKILADKYRVVRKGCSVRLTDPEDETDFHVDVVPGRFVEDNDGDVFLYPSSGIKERLRTNLDVHIDFVRNSAVVDAIRLMKLWRARSGMQVKTFVLELLTIKLLQEKKKIPLTDQLLHVWTELRDNIQTIAIEDPANPEGNDLSDSFNQSVKSQLSSQATTTLHLIEQSGWEAVFGKLQSDKQESDEALRRISVTTPSTSKPWTRGK